MTPMTPELDFLPSHCVLPPTYDDKIVLLVGAGASTYLGLPGLNDLLSRGVLCTDDEEIYARVQRTRMAIESVPDRYTTAAFEELIFRLKAYLQTSEMMHTDFTFKSELGVEPQSVATGAFQRKWKQALTACYRTLIQEYGPEKIDTSKPAFEATVKLFESLAELNCGKVHIYTTNYDCSFQVMASKCQELAFLTHIDNQEGDFRETWYYAVSGDTVFELPSIFVHRLHGCVAWFSDERTRFRTEEVFGAGHRLQIRDDEFLHRMCIKLITSRELGANPAFFLAFEEFSNHLSSARILVVWGHSFRDIEVLRKINNCLLFREEPLDIYYIDPFLNEEDARTNIHRTLRDAPVRISPLFSPKRIPWIPTDGHDALVRIVVEYLSERMEAYGN